MGRLLRGVLVALVAVGAWWAWHEWQYVSRSQPQPWNLNVRLLYTPHAALRPEHSRDSQGRYTIAFAVPTCRLAPTLRLLSLAGRYNRTQRFRPVLVAYAGGTYDDLLTRSGLPVYRMPQGEAAAGAGATQKEREQGASRACPGAWLWRLREALAGQEAEPGWQLGGTAEALTLRVMTEVDMLAEVAPWAVVDGGLVSPLLSCRAAGVPLIRVGPWSGSRPWWMLSPLSATGFPRWRWPWLRAGARDATFGTQALEAARARAFPGMPALERSLDALEWDETFFMEPVPDAVARERKALPDTNYFMGRFALSLPWSTQPKGSDDDDQASADKARAWLAQLPPRNGALVALLWLDSDAPPQMAVDVLAHCVRARVPVVAPVWDLLHSVPSEAVLWHTPWRGEENEWALDRDEWLLALPPSVHVSRPEPLRWYQEQVGVFITDGTLDVINTAYCWKRPVIAMPWNLELRGGVEQPLQEGWLVPMPVWAHHWPEAASSVAQVASSLLRVSADPAAVVEPSGGTFNATAVVGAAREAVCDTRASLSLLYTKLYEMTRPYQRSDVGQGVKDVVGSIMATLGDPGVL